MPEVAPRGFVINPCIRTMSALDSLVGIESRDNQVDERGKDVNIYEVKYQGLEEEARIACIDAPNYQVAEAIVKRTPDDLH